MATSKSDFLNFKPSHIAAAALVFNLGYQKIKVLGQQKIKCKPCTVTSIIYPSFLDYGLELWEQHHRSLTEISPTAFMEPLAKLA
jgi:hypothetical protein